MHTHTPMRSPHKRAATFLKIKNSFHVQLLTAKDCTGYVRAIRRTNNRGERPDQQEWVLNLRII